MVSPTPAASVDRPKIHIFTKIPVPLLRVFGYLRRYPLLASGQLLCAVLMSVLMIVFPYVTKEITGRVIPEKDLGALLPLTLMALGGFAFTNLFNALRIILNNTFEQKVICLLYTSPSPRDKRQSRMPSSA